MKHSDLMILHKIKYKHIGMLLLFIGALSFIWTHHGLNKNSEFLSSLYAAFSVACILVLLAVILTHIIDNWNKTIL